MLHLQVMSVIALWYACMYGEFQPLCEESTRPGFKQQSSTIKGSVVFVPLAPAKLTRNHAEIDFLVYKIYLLSILNICDELEN